MSLHLAVFYAALAFLAGSCLEGLIAPRKYEKRGGRLDRTWDGGYEAGQEDLAREITEWEDEHARHLPEQQGSVQRAGRGGGGQGDRQAQSPARQAPPAEARRDLPVRLVRPVAPDELAQGPLAAEEEWTVGELRELSGPVDWDSPGPERDGRSADARARAEAGPGVDRDPYWLERGMVWLAEWHRETWELEEQGNALVAAWVAESRAMLAESSWTNRMLEAATHG